MSSWIYSQWHLLCLQLVNMFYYSNGKRVDIFNKRPRNLSAGGPIKDDPKIHDKKNDTVSSWLEYGSLVIPVPVMRSGIMNKYHGMITGKKQLHMHQLGKTIVMPGEMVVNKKYAGSVEHFLKEHGITLPLTPGQKIPKFT